MNDATYEASDIGGARVAAHAKINLLLRVLARETSGYHGVETLLQTIELADIVTVRVGGASRTLSCDGPALPAGGIGPAENNLAFRAAVAYAEAATWVNGWHIDIEKHIPVGGGLGGGSADAAGVLRALELLAPQPLGRERISEIAGRLGADVAFLAHALPLAFAWGRGDRLLPLASLPPMSVTLLSFDGGVDTASAYKTLAASRDAGSDATKRSAPAMLYPIDAFGSWSSIAGVAHNDFEAVVTSAHEGVARWLPAVRHAASRLSAAGAPAIGMMSGSGATCFVLHPLGMPLEFPTAPGMRIIETRTLSRIAPPFLHGTDG